MIKIRKSNERGHANHGWLDTYHTFSFADFYDPKCMSFGPLHVINEDWVEPGQGFPTHPHRDMEIITYILEGALEHKDSMGTGSVIRPGEVQVMSAGAGVTHSEFNHSAEERVHLLQIWLLPDQKGLVPSYNQREFGPAERLDQLRLVASGNGRLGSLRINQDADLYASTLTPEKTVSHSLRPKRLAWLQMARGVVDLNGKRLSAGDGAEITEENVLNIKAEQEAEFLLFDMA